MTLCAASASLSIKTGGISSSANTGSTCWI
jgi:hypothetical protein